MNKFRKRFAVLFSSVVLAGLMLGATAGVTSAAWFSKHESSCAIYMVSNSACFKENTDGSGDILFLLQGNPTRADNLGAINVPSGTLCSGAIFNNGTWNDCLSFVYYNLNSGSEVCVFTNSFESGLLWSAHGPTNGVLSHVFSGSSNDNISSIVVENTIGGQC